MDERKNVLIIGASSPIARELQRIYAANSYKVFTTLRYSSRLSSVQDSSSNLYVDINDEASVKEIVSFTIENRISNICYFPGHRESLEFSKINLHHLQQTFFVNVFAYWLLISGLSETMKKRNYGRFVSFSSIGSKFGGSEYVFGYTSSKRCLEFFPKAFADLASSNVFINNLIVGATDTSFLRSKKNFNLEERAALIPAKRLARPHEIAQIAYSLCSELNTYQTLTNITIAGGE